MAGAFLLAFFLCLSGLIFAGQQVGGVVSGAKVLPPPATRTPQPTFSVQLLETSIAATPTLFTGVGVDHIPAFFLTDPDGTYCAAMGRLDRWEGPSPRECLVTQDPFRVISDDGGVLVLRAEANAAPLVWVGWTPESPDTAIFWATTRASAHSKVWVDSAYARTADGTIFAILGHNTKRCVGPERCAVEIPRNIAGKLVVAIANRESEVELVRPGGTQPVQADKVVVAEKPVIKKAPVAAKPTAVPVIEQPVVAVAPPAINRVLHPDLGLLGVGYRETSCTSGFCWRVVGIWFFDNNDNTDWNKQNYAAAVANGLAPYEMRGKEHVFVDLVDEAGQRLTPQGQMVNFFWGSGQSKNEHVLVAPDKPAGEPCANLGMVNAGNAYSVEVLDAGATSEVVYGMGLGRVRDPNNGELYPGKSERAKNWHVSYYVQFQRVPCGGQPVQMAATAPVAPALVAPAAVAPVAVGGAGQFTAGRGFSVWTVARVDDKARAVTKELCGLHSGDTVTKIADGSKGWAQVTVVSSGTCPTGTQGWVLMTGNFR